ncbi:MAG: hypothetical protein AAF430_12780 [Myxococcota bacterium]
MSVFLASPGSAIPDPTPDPDATVVYLRQDCGNPAMENCFESMTALSEFPIASAPIGWIWTKSTPVSATNPLIIDVGPGTFEAFQCGSFAEPEGTRGWVTVRGSGREVSILREPGFTGPGVRGIGCVNLSFIDIGVHGGVEAARWIRGGSSSWSNVDILSHEDNDLASPTAANAWVESCGTSDGRAVHYFHGSRIRRVGLIQGGQLYAFSACAESWFFGGEISLEVPDDDYGTGAIDANFATLYLNGLGSGSVGGDVRVFGTAIRATVKGYFDSTSSVPPIRAVEFSGNATGGVFHSHGSIISVNANVDPQGGDPLDVAGIVSLGTNQLAHTPGTAFVLNVHPTATAERLRGGATFESPFLWQAGASAPPVISKQGADLYVETDCDGTGDCSGGSADEPHLMVYSENCSAGGPWFNTVTAACRLP